jgi:hypothetical protein
MADPKVTLYWSCKAPAGWKRYPAAWGRNGKVRPQYAQVKEAQLHFPVGHYELRHSIERKTIWTKCQRGRNRRICRDGTSCGDLAGKRGC